MGGGGGSRAAGGSGSDGVVIIRYTTPGPVANFTATPFTGTAPLAVRFTDTSTGLADELNLILPFTLQSVYLIANNFPKHIVWPVRPVKPYKPAGK
jgi:hypothetical protein